MPGFFNPLPSSYAPRVAAAQAQRSPQKVAAAAGPALEERRQVQFNQLAEVQGEAALAKMESQRASPARAQTKFRGVARLRTLSKDYSARSLTSPINAETPEGSISIWLPCLPETIELARANHYDQAGNTLVTPDGIWVYQYTEPLEIPLTFHLHAFDDLCPDGAKTLLDIAARLQAMQLPVSNDRTNDYVKAAPKASANLDKGSSSEQKQTLIQLRGAGIVTAPDTVAVSKDPNFKFPAACELRLMSAGSRTYGINCVGFIKQTKISLHGPYLNTVDESEGFNLPSAATYEFTFVHNPAYTNALGSGKLVQAYGPDVYAQLYNTGHLAQLTGNTYDGLDSLSAGRSAGEIIDANAKLIGR